MQEHETLEYRLQRLSERAYTAVCDVRGYITKAEADAIEELERVLGKQWDAANGKWMSLDQE